jgi:hypothetical protein
MFKLWSAVLAVSLVLPGCQDPTGDFQTVVGTIDAGPPLADVIQGPATGSVGEPLVFTVSTFGNSCISSQGAKVVVGGLQATVTPYDREYRGPRECLDYLKAYPRTVTVVFTSPGNATVRVQGRSSNQSGLVSVDHAVTVMP